MFRSFQWRLVRILGLIILLTVVLSGGLAYWSTNDRFDLLVTDEDQQQVKDIAPLLEASYSYWGDWRNLDDLLTTEAISSAQLFEPPWISDVDWWQLTANVISINEQTLYDLYDELGTLAAVAEQQGIEPDAVIQTIVEAEQAAMNQAVAMGELTPGQVATELELVNQIATDFVWDTIYDESVMMLDWDAIIANALNISIDKLYNFLDAGKSDAEVARQQGIDPKILIKDIVTAEAAALKNSGQMTELEISAYLAEVEDEAAFYIGLGIDPMVQIYSDELVWTPEGIDWIFSNLLLPDQHLLVADLDGMVAYDSAGSSNGQRLPDAMLAQGVPLRDNQNNRPIGWAIIATGSNSYNTNQSSFLRNMTWAILISGLIAGVIAMLIGWVMARRVTAPVAALTAAADSMADGNNSIRVPVSSTDEFGRMSTAFNTMADEIERQQTLRQRLVDDIAHELKTPLSVIQLELAAFKDKLQTPEQATDQIQEEIDVLSNLVEDLTLLSEADEGKFQLTLEQVDLSTLTAQVIERWHHRAEISGIKLHLVSLEILPQVQADSVRISQVLGNLISNALKHTSRDGSIEIKCYESSSIKPGDNPGKSSYIWTTVTDSGEGINPDDLAHVFDRFYRADRSRNRQTGGRGLGLAIVSQIVESHNGEVWAEAQLGVGSSFGYSLPTG